MIQLTAIRFVVRAYLSVGLLFYTGVIFAQLPQGGKLSLRGNAMQVTIYRQENSMATEAFIAQSNLLGIGLHEWLHQSKTDSLLKNGWKIRTIEADNLVISKPLNQAINGQTAAERIVFSALTSKNNWQVMGGNRVEYGSNDFVNQTPYKVQDSIVTFVLRGFEKAKQVKLAGSFTDWQQQAFEMRKVGKTWVADVRLPPGPHYYKFLIDNNWRTDPDNLLTINDGEGNTNSVFFVPNTTFKLPGFLSSERVFLSASFNNFARYQLPLQKQVDGWELPLYVAEGTHQYYFWADDVKVLQTKSGLRQEMQTAIGSAHKFKLRGFSSAKTVVLAGNFNDWGTSELRLYRTADGWELPYVLGPGNYQYKFIVDGRWITDPAAGPPIPDGKGNQNSFLVVAPNHKFELEGYGSARNVFVAGDFNDWSEVVSPMKKNANGVWLCPVFLARGKHRYKFIVDGKWIIDPKNPLWEDNEHNTSNSVLWRE